MNYEDAQRLKQIGEEEIVVSLKGGKQFRFRRGRIYYKTMHVVYGKDAIQFAGQLLSYAPVYLFSDAPEDIDFLVDFYEKTDNAKDFFYFNSLLEENALDKMYERVRLERRACFVIIHSNFAIEIPLELLLEGHIIILVAGEWSSRMNVFSSGEID